MTIKPVTNQKANEKKDGHGQEAASSTARANHRAILTTKSSSETQSPQRRNDVFDEILRHRRSPHKGSSASLRAKRDHHKRDTREKHTSASPQYHAVHSPHAAHTSTASCVVVSKSPKHHGHGTAVGHQAQAGVGSSVGGGGCSAGGGGATAADLLNILDEHRDVYSGYNSGDEHLVPKETALTADEWKHRDEQFIKAMAERGFIIQDIVEDGACLFRAISLQIFGDQEMHEVIRQQTMDYIYQNREYFAHFVTEDITSYVKRKRNKDSHGNHIEIQAMSEIYNRSVELYCYQTTPTNIFNSEQSNNGYDPLRLSYQRGSHYNAILDPYNASVGVGLGLAGYKPESQTREAIRLSEQQEIEQTMFEDKLKTTDWEATNEAIEEQIARESYLQWCRDNTQAGKTTTTTVTRSTSTASSTNSTILSSTITSSASAATGSCTTDNGKDGSINLTTAGVESIMMPSVSDSLPSGSGYDSDDTDMSSTSSTTAQDSLYQDSLQLGLLKKMKYGKRGATTTTGTTAATTTTPASTATTGACGSGKRRGKRRYRAEGNDTTNICSCDSSAMGLCPHKRAKLIKAPSPLQHHHHHHHHHSATSEASASANQQPTTVDANTSNEWSTFDAAGVPGTSKQAATTEKPVSSFYQSLLESSYADDGLGQMSESEMIVKAIRLSRIDFFECAKRQREQEQHQQQVSSPSPAPNRDICNSSRQQQGSSAERPMAAAAATWIDYEDDDSDVTLP